MFVTYVQKSYKACTYMYNMHKNEKVLLCNFLGTGRGRPGFLPDGTKNFFGISLREERRWFIEQGGNAEDG